MKTIVIIIVVFVIGFFIAKNVYQDNSITPSPVELENNKADDPIELDTQTEPINNEAQTKGKSNSEATQPINIKNPNKSGSYKDSNTDGYVPDQKMKDYEKQLEQLDQKINNDLDKLRKSDKEATDGLVNEINKKEEGLLPGDDEHTEKEYQ